MQRVAHHNHVPDDRMAIAPYNFVPLPETVTPVDADPPPYDRYDTTRKAGRIDCCLVTESPLYVRCPLTRQQFVQGERERGQRVTDYTRLAKNSPEFFYTFDQQKPVIPGSSLRGMLRTLVEIASFATINRVTRRKPFFRALADDTLRGLYQRVFVTVVPTSKIPRYDCYQANIHTGFLRRSGEDYFIEECEYARIDHHVSNPLGLAAIPDVNGQPFLGRIDWRWQHKLIYVDADPEDDHLFPANNRHDPMYLRFRAVRQADFTAGVIPSAVKGTLVITGPMQNKHMEFVFLHNTLGAPGTRYPAKGVLNPAMVNRFHDDDQISQWQERNFPVDQPQANSRRRSGMLRDGEPVFFLLDANNNIRFFGRAQMFRLPYEHSPYDLIPQNLHNVPVLDIAEAIFGYVRDQKQVADQNRAGRIFVSDAQLVTETDNPWLRDKPLTPRILGTPKPTTFQHYLAQDDVQKLRHYSSQDAEIRGHKLYWHKDNPGIDQIEDVAFLEKLADPSKREHNENPIADTQHTRLRPVKPGMKFCFSIHFENLTDVELGALLWVLRYGDDRGSPEGSIESYRLSLGMGKPLGMGAIKVTYDVVITQRNKRYRKLLDDQGWESGDDPRLTEDACNTVIKTFTDHVLQQVQGGVPFEDIPRIRALRALLRWPGPKPVEQFSRYLEIERDKRAAYQLARVRFRHDRRRNREIGNEYTLRPILPTPLQVLSKAGVPLSGTPKPGRSARPTNKAPTTQLPSPMRNNSASPNNPAADPTTPRLTAFIQSVQRSNAGSLPNLINQWRALDPRIQREAAQAMINRAQAIKVKDLADKPWFKELQMYLGSPSKQ